MRRWHLRPTLLVLLPPTKLSRAPQGAIKVARAQGGRLWRHLSVHCRLPAVLDGPLLGAYHHALDGRYRLTLLSQGGSFYSWKSAAVISTLVIGFVLIVVFVLYGKYECLRELVINLTVAAECYMPLKRPIVPMHLFRSVDFCILTIVSGVGGMLYYSMNG